MGRKINFNAGPAALPESVLQEVAAATIDYNNTGLSILELPHRGKEFLAIIEESKQLVRELCSLDDRYEILWLHGGGRLQFCMIPMNFLPAHQSAGYINSGHWAEEAAEYAAGYGDVQILASSKEVNYSHLPEWPANIPDKLAYLHFTTNSTIYGTQWHHFPEVTTPLIADMSSDIFSRRHNYSRYAMFYAAAQKNLGVAGVALAVIRKDMLNRTARILPPMLSYKQQALENSILNTANVAGIYTSLLMLRWTKNKGIQAIEEENNKKAQLLYDALDNSKTFIPYVTEKTHRSLMNVCFTADTPANEALLLQLCDENNITGIRGHRSVGGFRVSLYNAVSLTAVEKLVALIKSLP